MPIPELDRIAELDRSHAPEAGALAARLRLVLRPVVRLMMRSGITFPACAELLRGLFVEVAAEDLLANPTERTDSRISLLSGVHRKEIRRLRELAGTGVAEPPMVGLASAIIARWLADHASPAGAPNPLPRNAAEGPSFERLVQSVTKDVRPRTVLDDWLAQNMAHMDSDDMVHLNHAAFLPRPGGAEQLFFFGRNLHDHAAAAAANVLSSGTAPFLDRSAHFDQVPEDLAARIEAMGRDAAQRMLVDLHRAAVQLVTDQGGLPERAPGEPRRRVNVGVYVYHADAPPAAQG